MPCSCENALVKSQNALFSPKCLGRLTQADRLGLSVNTSNVFFSFLATGFEQYDCNVMVYSNGISSACQNTSSQLFTLGLPFKTKCPSCPCNKTDHFQRYVHKHFFAWMHYLFITFRAKILYATGQRMKSWGLACCSFHPLILLL